MPRPLVLAVLLVIGCGDADGSSPVEAPAVRDDVAADGGQREAVRPGARLDRLLADRGDDAALLADLRPPRSATARAVENRHVPGQVDTVRTRTYDGLVIEAYEVRDGPTFIQRVTVTDVGYGTASGLAVDELRTDVEAVLGPPLDESGAEAVYETGDESTPTVVEVTYEPDERGRPRASQITWRPYVD